MDVRDAKYLMIAEDKDRMPGLPDGYETGKIVAGAGNWHSGGMFALLLVVTGQNEHVQSIPREFVKI